MLLENTLNAMLDNTVISTHDYKMVVFPVMEVRHGCCSRSTGMATDYINNVLNSSYRQIFHGGADLTHIIVSHCLQLP